MNNKNMKIGFISVGDGDYVDPKAQEIIDNAILALRQKEIDLAVAERIVLREYEAEEISKSLLKNNVDGVIVFLGCWAQCDEVIAVVREIEHLPFLLWGVPMYENENGDEDGTGAYVSFSMVQGPLKRLGYTYSAVMGMPEKDEVIQQVVDFCICAKAASRLKRTRIGKVGSFSVGIWTGAYDHVYLRGLLGPNVINYDSYSIINKAESYSDEECESIVDYIKSKAQIGNLVTKGHLYKIARLYKSLRYFCDEDALQAMTVKCQYEFSKEYGMVMCVPLSLLTDSGIVSGCESDIPCIVTQIIFNYLTGQDIGYGDVFNNVGNVIKLSACGFAPFSVAKEGEAKIEKMTRFEGFKGVNDRFVYKPGVVTFARLVEGCGEYKMIAATGKGIETEIRQGCMPALDVELHGSLEKFMGNFNGQHYAICYGDITDILSKLCNMLGIEFIKI